MRGLSPRGRRSRLGVAILFDAELSAEVNGLRRALGEPDLARIAPHLTLVPPVNVRDVADANRVVRAAVQATLPFELEIGPLATFLPHNPVAYLAVGGNVDALHGLRDRVFHPPLHRELTWPFVPHVTVADGIEPERIEGAVRVLTQFRRAFTVKSVHVLEERGRVWEPVVGFPLGPPHVIGRGGLPIELDVVDSDDDVVITAYADGNQVGRLVGWAREGTARVDELHIDDAYRGEVDHHLEAAFHSWVARR